MKQEINAILILLAFPLLFIGGNSGNLIIASIGILLLLLNAAMIAFKKKPFKK